MYIIGSLPFWIMKEIFHGRFTMACYEPVAAWRDSRGVVGFTFGAGGKSPPDSRPLRVPCGRCVGCRLDRASSWAVRCQHEASLYDGNSFVTLTYDDDFLPVDGSLRYRDVQLFLKRLRRMMSPVRVRFFCGGEYGELNGRPHYHLLLFNSFFSDRVPIGKGLYESESLSRLWSDVRSSKPLGYASVGDVTPASCAYVAKYALKKVYGRQAGIEYYVDEKTGAVRQSEFCTMSRRPGIGAEWYEKFSGDVFPGDFVIVNGRQVRVPRYYSEKLKACDPRAHGDVVEDRERKVLEIPVEDRTPARRAAAAVIKEASLAVYSQRRL